MRPTATRRRKQRHTAKRIHRRLVDEHGAEVAETTVRDYVRARKRQMGWPGGEVHVPQVHAPGAGAEVDWGQAQVELAGVAVTVRLFVMRASFSGAAFCQASLVETQQAFLELHAQAFEWFGGVFAAVRFDNLTSAVKAVLKGRRRVESDRFVALRSHYLFASEFTTPGIEGAHEKGGVEGEVGRFRRNHLVPVPSFTDLAERLLGCCESDLARRIVGRQVTVGEAFAQERPLLAALPAERFDATETATPRVDSKSLVTVRQNRYSVPVALAGLKVGARIAAREIPSATPARSSRSMSGCTAGSAPAPGSITTSSCLSASPAHSSTRWRSVRSATAATGRRSSTSSGRR